MNAKPVGLAGGVRVTQAVKSGEVLHQSNVALDPENPALRLHDKMESAA